MIVAYLRVSTGDQTVETQKIGVEGFAAGKGWKIDKWVDETRSGTTKISERELGDLLKNLCSGDILVVSELSRIGRSIKEVTACLGSLIDRNISVFSVKEAMELTGNSMQTKVMRSLLILMAELERDFISARTKEGLARVKSKGKTLGRPVGSVGSSKLDQHHEAIWDEWNQFNPSVTYLARKYNCSFQTMKNFIERKIK